MGLDERTQLAEAGGDDRSRAAADAVGHALRQAGDPNRRIPNDLTAIGLQLIRHQLQQRRLAASVATHKTDTLPADHAQREPLQQRIATEAELDIAKGDQIHGSAASVKARHEMGRRIPCQ